MIRADSGNDLHQFFCHLGLVFRNSVINFWLFLKIDDSVNGIENLRVHYKWAVLGIRFLCNQIEMTFIDSSLSKIVNSNLINQVKGNWPVFWIKCKCKYKQFLVFPSDEIEYELYFNFKFLTRLKLYNLYTFELM